MFCMLKKEKNISYLYFKNNSNREKQVIVLMIPNGKKQWHKEIISIIKRSYIKRIVFTPLEQKTSLNCIKRSVKRKTFVM